MKDLKSYLRKLQEDPASVQLTLKKAIQCRNYIMLLLTLMNACRSSNLTNITIKDLEEAEDAEDCRGAKVLKSKRYALYVIRYQVFHAHNTLIDLN